jgi:sterol desaturase/sphingolipid hydroxylase (fatty acid hydroxylase superfamily)
LARYNLELWGWPVMPIVGLFLASMLFGVSLGWYFLSPRVHKLSLVRLFKKRRRDPTA